MSSYITRKTPGDTAWFTHDRFGMFIHWGLYALPARHEWVKTNERIPEETYQRYFDRSTGLFDPREWARQAKAGGDEIRRPTTKHHEGFCLFDSAYTDYKSTNTKVGRDLCAGICRRLPGGGAAYRLLLLPHRLAPSRFPHRSPPSPPGRSRRRTAKPGPRHAPLRAVHEKSGGGAPDELRKDRYSVVRLLLSGHPSGGQRLDEGQGEGRLGGGTAHRPGPPAAAGIIIDNRTGLEQDLWTPEQYQPQEWIRHPETGERVVWEACQTFSGSWGYHRDETSWKSPETLLLLLIRTVSLGGNLLMNVGPTARGYFDQRAEAALEIYADWMRLNSRSIYGCTMAEPAFIAPNGCLFTQSEDGSRLYVHLVEYPFGFLELPGLAGQVAYAQFLHDGSELLFREKQADHFSEGKTTRDDLLVITLPPLKPPVLIPVVELFLK